MKKQTTELQRKKFVTEFTVTVDPIGFLTDMKMFKSIRLKTKTGRNDFDKLYLKLEKADLRMLVRMNQLSIKSIIYKCWENDNRVMWIEKIKTT